MKAGFCATLVSCDLEPRRLRTIHGMQFGLRAERCIVHCAENGPPISQRPTADSPDFKVEKWIRDKYERKLFCFPDREPPSVPPQVKMCKGNYCCHVVSPAIRLACFASAYQFQLLFQIVMYVPHAGNCNDF